MYPPVLVKAKENGVVKVVINMMAEIISLVMMVAHGN